MESGGEITPELEARLDISAEKLPQKVDNYNFIIQELEGQAQVWKMRKDASNAIQKQFEGHVERVKDRIREAMRAMNASELAGNLYKFQLRKSQPKLVIDDENKIPDEFKMVVQTTVLDKERVKAALVDGFDVPGAHVESNGSLYPMANNGGK